MLSKIKTYLPLILVAIVAICSLSFAEVKLSDETCSEVAIEIVTNDNHADFFIEEDIYNIVEANRSMFISSKVEDIDVYKLEDKIKKHPCVLDCETYLTIDGCLHMIVTQRTPIVRINLDTTGFYIDETCQKMPLSKRGVSRVVVASGYIEECDTILLQDIYTLAHEIRNDEELCPLIDQIYVTPEKEFVLVAKVGPSKVEFGTVDDYSRKFNYLKAFYKAPKVKENWRLYKSISLKYSNQIVCTKY